MMEPWPQHGALNMRLFVLDPEGPGSRKLVYLCIQNSIPIIQSTISVYYIGTYLLSRFMDVGWDRDWATRAEIHYIYLRAQCVCTGQNSKQVSVGDALTGNAHKQHQASTEADKPLGICLRSRRGKLMTSSFRPNISSVFFFFLFACTGHSAYS